MWSGKRGRVSISNYRTDSGSEFWNSVNKAQILETIVHEFAHLILFSRDVPAGHGRRFRNILYELLCADWKELVAMYNLLEGDNMSDSLIDLLNWCTDKSLKQSEFLAFEASYNVC